MYERAPDPKSFITTHNLYVSRNALRLVFVPTQAFWLLACVSVVLLFYLCTRHWLLACVAWRCSMGRQVHVLTAEIVVAHRMEVLARVVNTDESLLVRERANELMQATLVNTVI